MRCGVAEARDLDPRWKGQPGQASGARLEQKVSVCSDSAPEHHEIDIADGGDGYEVERSGAPLRSRPHARPHHPRVPL